MPPQKDEHLDVRLKPGDLEKIRAHAARDHLAPTTWVRRLVLMEIDRVEGASKDTDGRGRGLMALTEAGSSMAG
jgi:hypothetical protein